MARSKQNNISKVVLTLATNEDVKEWSNGEVISPETINYKSFKPEKNGLFDELIFGPTTDYKCPICATKYKRSNEGTFCDKTEDCKLHNPEILPKSARRSRVGHIQLASPVVHYWFFKIDHSILAKILGLKVEGQSKNHSKSTIEGIIYFKYHIVLESGGIANLPKHSIIDINHAPLIYKKTFEEIRSTYDEDEVEYDELTEHIDDLVESAISKIGKDYGIDFYDLNDIIEEYWDADRFKAKFKDSDPVPPKIGTGAKAIQYLLENVDLKKQVQKVKREIKKINADIDKWYKEENEKDSSSTSSRVATKVQRRAKLYKRLEVLNPFIKSGQSLDSFMISTLPIIPADLRPLVQIDGGRHSTSDVNELYRRIIIRNNRLFKWIKLDAPMLIIQNELRMLQEAVDALIDNSRKKPPVMSKDSRALKSLADALTGKKGRFRQNLLGKRVDYSGRSVIVVGPDLKMHQAGIPRQMASKLFEPWIINELINADIVSSIKAGKKMVEEQNLEIWPFVEKAIEGKVVLLNRAPTLHRLSVQAFEPKLVRGKAIKLHPLVTTAFNADFDGDQMAVHVPISEEAIREARELMLANKNILGPKDGEPIINPSQDMTLGLFYLTREVKGVKGEGRVYSNYNEMIKAFELQLVDIHARIALPVREVSSEINPAKGDYVISTVGKFIFNKSFPETYKFIFTKNSISSRGNIDDRFIVKKGTNITEYIDGLQVLEPFGKKDIAKIIRNVFDDYTTLVSKEDVANVLKKIKITKYTDTIMQFGSLIDYKGENLSVTHCAILQNLVKDRYSEMEKKLSLRTSNDEKLTLSIDDKVELLEKIWFDYTNLVASTLDNLKELGFFYSMKSGATMSISDIKVSPRKPELIKQGNKHALALKKSYEMGELTDDERYQLVIKKWAEIKEEVQLDLNSITSDYPENPIFMMMNSGARGNISNFVQLAGLRGLMANNKKGSVAHTNNNIVVRSTVEVPVKSSFLEGLTAYEFYSSTHGARKGLTDTALNTAKSGYLTRRLVDVTQNIVVREEDCGTDQGHIVKTIIDTKNGSTIVDISERVEGRYTNGDLVDLKGGLILESGKLITPDIVEKISKAKLEKVHIRSVLGCKVRDGVCKKCYGKDLATNRPVQLGEAVGIIAAQSIGEPGTQLTMRTFHTGGVAGVEDITGGFDRLIQLIDATKTMWEKEALISKTEGVVQSIIDAKDSSGNSTSNKIINIEANDDAKTIYPYTYLGTRAIRVKKGQKVNAGTKLVEGPIILNELLEVGGTLKVEKYLIKEVQRLYRMQGIAISDKYIEIIVRQMFSKVRIQDAGDSKLFVGSMVDVHKFTDENKRLLLAGKKPAYGKVLIIGAKQLPLYSDSFLAAASYQETSKVLVHAALKGKTDDLIGLKENIIVGHKIPAGTFSAYENKGKYDIRNPRSFFK